MQNENALGAPTEGLGQKVTFGFDSGPVPQLQLAERGRLQAGVQGGDARLTTQAVGVAAQEDPTVALLMKQADALLKPNIEKARTEAFVVGMQRAMAGEAVNNIAQEQPWYATLFGDSDVVEGARAYASQTIAQTEVAAMEDKMPELRKMGPAEAQKFFVDSVQSKLTGDRGTDANVLQAMTRALPAVMRRQAKEHYGWQQEEATAAEAAAFDAGAANLQAAAKGLASGTTTPEDFAALADGFVRSQVPVAGRDEKNYRQSKKNSLIKAAQSGQFHALNAMRDRGFMTALDADEATAVERAVESGEAKVRTKYSGDWSDALAGLQIEARNVLDKETTNDLKKKIDGINDTYRKETGSKLDFISPDTRAAMLAGKQGAIIHEHKREADKAEVRLGKAQTEAEKAAAIEHKKSVIATRLAEGGSSLTYLVASKDYTDADINEVALPQYIALNPAGQAKMLGKTSYTFSAIRDSRMNDVQAAITSPNLSTVGQQVIASYAALAEVNPEKADDYYGRYAPQLRGYVQDIKMGFTPESAYQNRFVNPPNKTKLPAEGQKALIAQINDQDGGFVGRWLGDGVKLQPSQAEVIAGLTQNHMEAFLGAHLDPKTAAKAAVNAAKQDGLEVLGGYGWKNGKGQVSLTDYLVGLDQTTGKARKGFDKFNVADTDSINNVFAEAMEYRLYGGEGVLTEPAAQVRVWRGADKDGVPQFVLSAFTKSGQTTQQTISANDVFRIQNEAKAKVKATELTLGTPIKAAPGAPSIYASDAAWAAYRASQKAGTN